MQTNKEEMTSFEGMGRRKKVICGKVSDELYSEVKAMIGNDGFGTMNDIVEMAVWEFVMKRKSVSKDEGGARIAV